MKNKENTTLENSTEEKPKVVMLLDGDVFTNFVSHELIRETKLADIVLSFNYAEHAYGYLEYISKSKNPNYPVPDYIFIEIDLPGPMNGYAFLKKIKEKLPFKHFKIMIVTSRPIVRSELKPGHYPFMGYIHKPLREDHLLNLASFTEE